MTLTQLKALAQTGLRAVVGLEVSIAVLAYLAVWATAGWRLEPAGLALVVAAALAPDLDLIPFLFVRRRLRFSSHRRIGHHPLLLIPLVAAASWALARGWGLPHPIALGLLAGLAVLAHLLHDGLHPVGLHWLSPLSWTHYRWDPARRRVDAVPDAALTAFYAAKAGERRSDGGWVAQITSRAPAASPLSLGLFAAAAAGLAVFALLPPRGA